MAIWHAKQARDQKRQENLDRAANVLQTGLIRCLERKKARKSAEAELQIRREIRDKELRECQEKILKEKCKAATKIQSRIRVYAAKKRVARIRKEKHRAHLRRARATAASRTVRRVRK